MCLDHLVRRWRARPARALFRHHRNPPRMLPSVCFSIPPVFRLDCRTVPSQIASVCSSIFARKIRPQMLASCPRQQLAQVIFDLRNIADGHLAGKRGTYAAVAVRRLVGSDFFRRLNVEKFRQDNLIACMRTLDVGNNLGRFCETVNEFGFYRQLHRRVSVERGDARLARLAPLRRRPCTNGNQFGLQTLGNDHIRGNRHPRI
jgi:hypothetical protein